LQLCQAFGLASSAKAHKSLPPLGLGYVNTKLYLCNFKHKYKTTQTVSL